MADSQPTRYLFVDCPDPKKLKLDRSKGSKSHVRAHVTKEYHRRVRMERLQAYKQTDANASVPPQTPMMATLAKEKLLPIRTNDLSSTILGRGGGSRSRSRAGAGAGAKGKAKATAGKGKVKGEGGGKQEEEEQEEAAAAASAAHDHDTNLALITASSSSLSSATAIEINARRQRRRQHQQQLDTIREMGIRYLNSLLSENRSDPFNCLSIPDLPKYSQKVLDYALTTTWPETVPTKGNALDNPVNRAWLQTCLDYPVLMHTFLYAAASQMSILYGENKPPALEKIRLAHYSESIKQVYKYISNLQGPPPEALIFSIVTLAVHGQPGAEPALRCHPKSPLHKLQYIHMYGSMYLAQEHLPALISLLERRGGISGINTYGMTETLQLADIYFATINCTLPYFGLVKVPEPVFANDKIKLDDQGIALMSELLSGFEYLQPSPSGQDLDDALGCVRDITVAADLVQRKVPGAPALYDLVPNINAAQFKMLSVDANIIASNSEEVSIVCISRLAALIYNDMVIYPCPDIQGVKVRTGGKLREALEYHFEQFNIQPHAKLLLWATVLGSIATSFTQAQPWFLRRLQWQAAELAINDWPSLQSLCRKYLWWGLVCDEPGLRIWNDMIAQGSSILLAQASD